MNTTTSILQALEGDPQTATKLAESAGVKLSTTRTLLSVLHAAGVVEAHRLVDHAPGQRGRRVTVWRLAPGCTADNTTILTTDDEV